MIDLREENGSGSDPAHFNCETSPKGTEESDLEYKKHDEQRNRI
jgi:hypothetical protein